MGWKQVQNPTILANLDDYVELPREVYALDISTNGDISGWYLVRVNEWRDSNDNVVTTARTDKEAEFMYFGSISGYAHTVYCSVVVGDSVENPESEFPTDFRDVDYDDKPDEFGVTKQEVRTADMPNIDDYQYWKSKKNRTTFESAQLQKLTELMASKIIMARDINHIRNAVTNTQLFCLSLRRALDDCVTDGENIGNGEGEVFYGLRENDDNFGQVMQFRTIKAGENITVTTNGEEIEISAENSGGNEGELTNDFCSIEPPLKAKSFETCGLYYAGDANSAPRKGSYIKFGSPYLGIKVRKAYDQSSNSLMLVFGQGNGLDQSMINAGRIFKGKKDFIIEMKTGMNTYSGLHIMGSHGNSNDGRVALYENDRLSHVQLAIERDAVPIEADGRVPSGINYVTADGDKDVYGIWASCGEPNAQ